MRGKRNREYGQKIGEAVRASIDAGEELPRATTWLTSWVEPGPARNRERRWLSEWLKVSFRDIPPEVASVYLREMAIDLEQLGADAAIDRFIDKILPRYVSNHAE